MSHSLARHLSTRRDAGVMVAGAEETVGQAFKALDEALESGDLETAVSLCAPDVLFVDSGQGERAVGRSRWTG